jgi:hypothetical protein
VTAASDVDAERHWASASRGQAATLPEPGEVPERLNGRDWKSRNGGQPRSRVRIPPSPLRQGPGGHRGPGLRRGRQSAREVRTPGQHGGRAWSVPALPPHTPGSWGTATRRAVCDSGRAAAFGPEQARVGADRAPADAGRCLEWASQARIAGRWPRGLSRLRDRAARHQAGPGFPTATAQRSTQRRRQRSVSIGMVSRTRRALTGATASCARGWGRWRGTARARVPAP